MHLLWNTVRARMWLSGKDCSSDFVPVSLVLWSGYLQERQTKIRLHGCSTLRASHVRVCVNARWSQTPIVACMSESIRILQQKNMEIRRETDEK